MQIPDNYAFAAVDVAKIDPVKLKELGIDDAVALIQNLTQGKLDKVCLTILEL